MTAEHRLATVPGGHPVIPLPPIGSRVLTECRDCGHIHRTGDEGLRCDAAQGRDVAALLRSFGVPREKWPAWVTADEIEEVLNDGG